MYGLVEHNACKGKFALMFIHCRLHFW